jgi:ParB-like chromosome segregation protein Spo0J
MASVLDAIKGAEAMANEPTINPDFQDLLDVQEQVSYDELKKMIEAEGIRDPIVVWQEQNMVADGHNRLKIAKELGIPCPRTDKSFANEAEVKAWIIRNQLGRRNLTPIRFQYFMGKLYNEAKATTTVEKQGTIGKVAEKLAKEFKVSEKTVRRAGVVAKGIDHVEKVRGKLAKQEQLSSKPTYTNEELTAIAQAPNAAVAGKTMDNIDTFHKKVVVQKAAKKAADKAVKDAVADKQTLYSVVLCAPDFEASGFTVAGEPKPTLDKNAAVYMIVPDEWLVRGVELMAKWSLEYQCSFVFWGNKSYDATFSKINHQNVFLATRGVVTGPKAGKEATSCILVNGNISQALIRLIDSYHNGGSKKLDMRRGVKPADGWDAVATK